MHTQLAAEVALAAQERDKAIQKALWLIRSANASAAELMQTTPQPEEWTGPLHPDWARWLNANKIRRTEPYATGEPYVEGGFIQTALIDPVWAALSEEMIDNHPRWIGIAGVIGGAKPPFALAPLDLASYGIYRDHEGCWFVLAADGGPDSYRPAGPHSWALAVYAGGLTTPAWVENDLAIMVPADIDCPEYDSSGRPCGAWINNLTGEPMLSGPTERDFMDWPTAHKVYERRTGICLGEASPADWWFASLDKEWLFVLGEDGSRDHYIASVHDRDRFMVAFVGP